MHHNSPDAVGEIKFIESPSIGSNYRGVKADDPASVSLLQDLLNQLNTGIHVRVWGDRETTTHMKHGKTVQVIKAFVDFVSFIQPDDWS